MERDEVNKLWQPQVTHTDSLRVCRSGEQELGECVLEHSCEYTTSEYQCLCDNSWNIAIEHKVRWKRNQTCHKLSVSIISTTKDDQR